MPASKPRPHPPALPHGEIREVFPGIHLVTGTVAMAAGVRFSRNMTVIKEGERLVLVNSVRLSEAGLKSLEALGKVTDVLRLAGFHGSDDAFYKERYGAKTWAIKGQRYTAGFDVNASDTYFEPDAQVDSSSELPLPGATMYVFGSKPPEGLLVLAREGGIVVSGDCLQHWHQTDPYFSFLGGLMMKMMGFIKPHNVGPGWLKQCKPPKPDLRGILDLEFANVLTSHGGPVVGGARDHYRPAVVRVS